MKTPRVNRMVCGGGGNGVGLRGGSLGGCVAVAVALCIAIYVLLMFTLALFTLSFGRALLLCFAGLL
jgi:hypothetical protein